MEIATKIQKVIDFDKKYSVLSDWERGFLESILKQAHRSGRLSHRQLEIFAKAEAKCTVNALEEAKEWATSYHKQYHEIAKTCARYYKTTGYFSALATKILEDSEFVPTQKQYKKMCENKYAKKVLAMVGAKPLYTIGTTVLFRRPALNYANRHLDGVPCLVLEVLDEIKSAVKGGKQYKVLPYGNALPCVVEERQIKKCTRSKPKKTPRKLETYDDIPF